MRNFSITANAYRFMLALAFALIAQTAMAEYLVYSHTTERGCIVLVDDSIGLPTSSHGVYRAVVCYYLDTDKKADNEKACTYSIYNFTIDFAEYQIAESAVYSVKGELLSHNGHPTGYLKVKPDSDVAKIVELVRYLASDEYQQAKKSATPIDPNSAN